jgi:hypothetical protein
VLIITKYYTHHVINQDKRFEDMSNRSALEVKIRITVLLLIWAAICLTAYSGRSTILDLQFKSDSQAVERTLPKYVMNWDKLND